ncbi:TetR/AcrR family transcriptional regulator [Nitrospinota bacterium]
MGTQTRKQRDLQAREALILDISSRMLLERGYIGMTMDRVAEEAEYSKGTIYQHFSCKEDVLAGIYIQTNSVLIEMFERGAAFLACSRERLVAVFEVYLLLVRLSPHHFRSRQIILMSPSVAGKASAERRNKLKSQEKSGRGIVLGIVNDAIAQGDLKPPPEFGPEDIVFGVWSIFFGAHALMATEYLTDWPKTPDPVAGLRRSLAALLDGYGWRPMSAEMDIGRTLARIRTEVFPEEFRKAQAI